jgi:hypothetical protein
LSALRRATDGGPRSSLFTLDGQGIAAFETSVGGELASGLVGERPPLDDAGQIAVKATSSPRRRSCW